MNIMSSVSLLPTSLGIISGPAEVAEGFDVDPVKAGIVRSCHAAGEPVVVVLAPLRRGHVFSFAHGGSLSQGYKEESAGWQVY